MPSGNPKIAEAGKKTRWKKGERPAGAGKPKGSKHINTWIQELLEDEDFVTQIRDGYELKEYKGAPLKAMILAQVKLAVNGDTKAFDALAKYGWTKKIETDLTTNGEALQPVMVQFIDDATSTHNPDTD